MLMSPLALLYGIGVWVNQALYKVGLLKSVSFSTPVISIGNLTVGGAGKSPHVEYLTRWLDHYLQIAILSRGYKRKSKGFRRVYAHSTVAEAGDESLQIKRKFPEVGVYVSESRMLGIPNILRDEPETQVIILDDAYQHRSVQPGMNILLTEYDNLFTRDYLLPMGRLREWRHGYRRADAIIVTKCPPDLNEVSRSSIRSELKPLPHQQMFFSSFSYTRMYHLLYPSVQISLQSNMSVVVMSGIARVNTLLEYIEEKVEYVKSLEYGDHHDYTNYEVAQLKAQYDQLETDQKIIVTTEKDAVRLEKHRLYLQEHELPIFVLPVFVTFGQDEPKFQQYIQQFLLGFKS